MKASQTQKKILLPLDGSVRSLGTVRYIAKIKAFHEMQVVLFHVHAGAPESYFDMKKDPRSTGTVAYVRAWEVQQRRNAAVYMTKAKQMLLGAGFSEDAVTVKIQKRRQGIARDIIKEARQGYNAVVARRRGLGALRGMVLGSVANKLLERLDFLPLLLAGRKPAGNNILLGFDGSPGAVQAVDFVKSILGSSDVRLCLLHVIRGRSDVPPENKTIYSPREYLEGIEKEMALRLDEIKAELVQSGFKANSVTTKIISGAQSRAAAIVEEARKNDYGTIVLGRRGLSQVRTFFIGRVTNKVVHMAKDRTVWIVR